MAILNPQGLLLVATACAAFAIATSRVAANEHEASLGRSGGEPKQGQTLEYALQAGAFANAAAAEAKVGELRSLGYSDARVSRSTLETDKSLYRVLVGQFDSKAEAIHLQDRLAANGINTFVQQPQKPHRTSVLSNSTDIGPMRSYFTSGAASFPVAEAVPLPAELEARRLQCLDLPATAPENLVAMEKLVRDIPDTHPEKSRFAVLLAFGHLYGKSAYAESAKNVPTDKLIACLLPVAKGDIVASDVRKLTAQELIAKLLHYYKNDRDAALLAYRHILAEAAGKSPRFEAQARLQVAALIYESHKQAPVSYGLLERQIIDLYEQNRTLDMGCRTSGHKDTEVVESATLRMGLMLSEVFMNQSKWNEAGTLVDSLIAIHKDEANTSGEVAELWFHKAKIHRVEGRYEESIQAARTAQKLASDLNRPVWGAAMRDVSLKALMAEQQGAELAKRSQTELDDINSRLKARRAEKGLSLHKDATE